MTVAQFVLLIAAGFGAGLIGYITGLASLVSYPALLAVGLTPVAANVTNTVALVGAGIGATASSTKELAKSGRSLLWLTLWAALGGIAGAVVLLRAPEGSFEAIVPVLIVFASTAMVLQPRIRKLAGGRTFPILYPLAIFFVAIYGGYFGAGAGVIFLALTLICTAEPIWRAALLKSYLLGVANLVAAVLFAFSGQVDWLAALAMAIGTVGGGAVGPRVVRRLPQNPLRIAVALSGFGLAAWLWLN
ncbi:MAG: sulfite exporter TauE/SafE family protein [Rhodococcus sp. (in: high G+C Gram-positive bacteria)]